MVQGWLRLIVIQLKGEAGWQSYSQGYSTSPLQLLSATHRLPVPLSCEFPVELLAHFCEELKFALHGCPWFDASKRHFSAQWLGPAGW